MLAEALAVSSVLQLAELANHLSLLHPCLQGDQQLQLFQISYQIFTNKKKTELDHQPQRRLQL